MPSVSGAVTVDHHLDTRRGGTERSWKAIHDLIQKTGLQPTDGRSPNQVALDETVIRITDERFWLYAAVDPDSNYLLHLRPFAITTTALTETFLRELRQKHDIESAVFLVHGAQHL